MPGFLNMILGGTALFSAQVNRTNLTGFRSGTGTGQTSQSVTVTTTNGVPPFTYLWQYVSGSLEIYPYNAVDQTTLFAAYLPSKFNYFVATWRCQVTDNIGNITYSPDITVTIYRTS